MSKINLIKSTGVIGFATATSRVLGFVRDIVIAGFFGTALYAQAFVVAFRIPNLLRDLIGEGATNAAFVPVLTEELTTKGKKDFFKLAQILLNILFVVLLVLTVIGILATPIIVRTIAPGFSVDKEKFEVTVALTRILFPFLLLVGLWAYAMGILNTMGKFAAPAFGPSVLNLSIIICAKSFGENVYGLASGVLIGGVAQLLLQFPSLYASGWRMALTNEFRHPQAKKIGILLLPRAVGSCVYQINVFVSTILASLSGIVGEGAVAALYFANRIWQLPLAIFGIALAQAALPAMSKHAALNDLEKLKDTLSFSLKILFFILIPATAGLMVLATPITKVLFQRGAFTAYSTMITSSALFYYATGLVACGGIKVLVSAFYSMHDTKTPVKIAAVSLVLNIALSFMLMSHFKVGGLALATSIAATFNFLLLFRFLRKKLGDFGTKGIIGSFLKVSASAAVMALIIKALLAYFPGHGALMLAVNIILGIAAFFAAAYLVRVRELEDFMVWISKRR